MSCHKLFIKMKSRKRVNERKNPYDALYKTKSEMKWMDEWMKKWMKILKIKKLN